MENNPIQSGKLYAKVNDNLKKRISSSFLIWLIPGIILLFVTIFSRNIPFFWDTIFFARGGMFFYENGVSNFILPQNIDTGGFPMYPLWLALGWSLFGKTLTVSHLLLYPVMLGIVYEFYKFSLRFLNSKMLPFAMLLIILEPTFITQCVFSAYDLLLLYFFMLALNALLANRMLLYSIALALIVLSSVRGVMVSGALFVIHLLVIKVYKNKIKWHSLYSYIIPVIVLITWMLWHKINTGWMLFSPERSDNHESLLSVDMMFRQFIYILWKLVDFGRIFMIIIIVLIYFIMLAKKHKVESDFKMLIMLCLLLLAVFAAFMIPFSNPVGHRYLLPLIVILPVVFLKAIQHFPKRIYKYILILLASAALCTGNFWLYPERFGNGWDCSLKVLPWFDVEKEILSYVGDVKIPKNEIAVEWPLYRGPEMTSFKEKQEWFTDIDDRSLNNFKYVLQTNICNSFTAMELNELRKSWIKVKHWQNGLVYAVLYKNPDYK